jgi:NhaA family Na+:H+ antiporter
VTHPDRAGHATAQAALFARGSWPEASRIADLLRQETVGGVLLVVAASVALVWANVAPDTYAALRDTVVGPAALHLDLSLGEWAADGLLALFFFVAGLELKREFVAGDLSSVRSAVVPVAAAVGGMAVPAVVYLVVTAADPRPLGAGWAIPTATDIAFALAVLALISTHLPSALRIFLLTLAVVDDLLAITVIAIFYTAHLSLPWLALALVPLAAFGLAVRRRVRAWYVLVPLALLTWALVHASGIHATVAGVLLAFTVPVHAALDRGTVAAGPPAAGPPASGPGPAEHFEHRLRPLSAGVAVPVFAFFAAGVTLGGWTGFTQAMSDRLTLGIVAALVVGKAIGILGSTLLVGRLTGSPLNRELSWWDVGGVALLGGMGFTVSLLIGELAFGFTGNLDDLTKVGVLVGSVVAALLATVVLRIRNGVYRRMVEEETTDSDADGVPDVYQTEQEGHR